MAIHTPVLPTDRRNEESSCCQTPGRNHSCTAIGFGRTLLRAQLLQEAHLHASRSLHTLRGPGKNGKLGASRIPRLGECGTFCALAGMLGSGHFFRGCNAPGAGVETNRFKFFAVHLHNYPSFISDKTKINLLRKRGAERRAAIQAAPSREPGHDANGSESFRWGSRFFALLLRNSIPQARSVRPLREIQREDSAPRRALARCVRGVPPKMRE